MPLYDFRCETCGIFEQWLTLAEIAAPVHCPTCSEQAKRIFSPPMLLTGSLRLQGSESREPQRVKRDREPASPRHLSARGRPWMIGH